MGEKVGDSAVASALALLYISLSDPVLVDKAMTTLSALFLIEDNLSDEKAEEINESRINDEKIYKRIIRVIMKKNLRILKNQMMIKK